MAMAPTGTPPQDDSRAADGLEERTSDGGCSRGAEQVYEPRNILLTGGAGFIGSHVAIRLLRRYSQYKVVVLDKLDYCSNLRNLEQIAKEPNFKFVKGDIRQGDLVMYLLRSESIDTILHFAAQTHVDNSFGDSFSYTENNTHGTHVLLECARAAGTVSRFVHVSTDEVYGEGAHNMASLESHTLQPTNPYSATKAAAEMLVKAYASSYSLPAIITRGNNVYGPHQYPEKLVPKFIIRAHRGLTLPVHGDGRSTRSFLYVEDVAEAFDVILHRGRDGGVYNVGSSEEKSVLDVAKEVCSYFGLDPSSCVRHVTDRPFNDRRYHLDDSKLANLGWHRRTPFSEGLRKTVDWCLSNLCDDADSYWPPASVEAALSAHPHFRPSHSQLDAQKEGSHPGDPGSSTSFPHMLGHGGSN